MKASWKIEYTGGDPYPVLDPAGEQLAKIFNIDISLLNDSLRKQNKL